MVYPIFPQELIKESAVDTVAKKIRRRYEHMKAGACPGKSAFRDK